MPTDSIPPLRKLRNKFAYAVRGARLALFGGNGFYLHGVAAVVVILLGWLLQVSRTEWLVLVLCITAVIAAELFNTAIEHLGKAITTDQHPDVRDALDVAAAAVLAVAVGAKIVWVIILAGRLFT